MPTRTQPTRRPAGNRLSRPGGTHAPRSARRAPSAGRRPAIPLRREPQKKTGMAKVMQNVGGALPGAGQSSRGSGGKGKGTGMGAGLAVLAGAAGLAMKNRGRLQSMMRRSDKERTAHADAPAHPVVESPPPAGPAGGASPNTTGAGGTGGAAA